MKKNFKAINFTQTRNTVTADKYVAHAIYVQNVALVEELGGQVCKGNEGFVAKFPTAAKAKEFVANAVCSISATEYKKARKTAPKQATAPAPKKVATPKAKAKNDGYITLTDDNGNTYRVAMSALGIVPANKPKSAEKKATSTAKKPQTPKGKSCPVDFSSLAGKGRAANAKASALINKAGFANNTAGYMAAWKEWCKVR